MHGASLFLRSKINNLVILEFLKLLNTLVIKRDTETTNSGVGPQGLNSFTTFLMIAGVAFELIIMGFHLQWGLVDAGFTKVLLFSRLKDEKSNPQIQIKLLIQNNYFKLKSPREFFFVTS